MIQLDELNPISLSRALPPVAFAAANARFLSRFPEGPQRGAGRQQAFAKFLRSENAKDDKVLSWTRKLFTGHEYACVGKATAAYLAVRESKLHIGVGYRNDAGEYELVAVESESWVEVTGLAFDELGKD